MRILTIRESTWSNSTPGSAWRRILSLEEWPDWSDLFAEVRWIGRSGWRAGHRFRLEPAGGLLPFPRFGTVSQVDPEQSVRWHSRVLAMRVEFALAIAAEGSGTRVQFRSTIRGLAVRLIGPDAIARHLCAFQRGFLAALRESEECIGAR